MSGIPQAMKLEKVPRAFLLHRNVPTVVQVNTFHLTFGEEETIIQPYKEKNELKYFDKKTPKKMQTQSKLKALM